MNGELAKKYPIDAHKLDKADYLQSLLKEACRLQLISDTELQQIQMQLLQLVSKQTERYTNGESSSVKVETAQQIMQSIFYTIGVYLKRMEDVQKSVELLKEGKMQDAFECGGRLIVRRIASAQVLLRSVQNNRIKTDNYAYNDTLDHAFSGFFLHYDKEYAAHGGAALIEYPLAYDRMDTCGIEYVQEYLEKLYWENQFCQKFAEEDVDCLIKSYDADTKDLLANIFLLVLTNALGLMLLQKSARRLYLTPGDVQELYKLLSPLAEEQIEIRVERGAQKLLLELAFDSPFLKEYIKMILPALSVKLSHAVCGNNLENLFICGKTQQPEQASFGYADGRKMSDERFREVTSAIRECDSVPEKIAMIQNRVHSMADLVDVFESYCIFEDEYAAVFASFDDNICAVLLQKMMLLETGDGGTGFDQELQSAVFEKEWQKQFAMFLQRADAIRLKKIEGLARQIYTAQFDF